MQIHPIPNHETLPDMPSATIDDHTLYPLVDGTRGFTGVVGGIDPTATTHLATKNYVDSSVRFKLGYFFNDTASDIGGIYYDMTNVELGGAESTLTTSGLPAGDDQALVNFATLSGEPGINTLFAGVYEVHFHAERTSGPNSVNLYYEIYSRTSGGTETLRMTSEISGLVTSKTDYSLYAVLASDVELNTTDRLVVKFYANVGIGSNVAVTLYQEGTTDSFMAIPVATNILSDIFLRQDGTKGLSANWDAGAFDIKAQSFTIGSASINETELETIDGVTAGTAAASKALIVGSSKELDQQFGARTNLSTLGGGVDPAATTDAGTVDALYSFEDSILDSGAGGHDLTLSAGTTTYLSRGTTKCHDFDGSTYYTATGYLGPVQAGSGLSVSVWVKPDGSGTRYIASWGDSGTNRASFQLGMNDLQLGGVSNTNTFSIFVGGGNINSDVDLKTDGLWHHVVATMAATANIRDIKIYIDGVLQVIADADITNPGSAMAVTETDTFLVASTNSSPGTSPFNGCIDELALYESVLSQADVTDIYERQRTDHVTLSGGATVTGDAIVGGDANVTGDVNVTAGLGVWGVTAPSAQPTEASLDQSGIATGGGGTAVTDTDTFDGGLGGDEYTIGDIVQALIEDGTLGA